MDNCGRRKKEEEGLGSPESFRKNCSRFLLIWTAFLLLAVSREAFPVKAAGSFQKNGWERTEKGYLYYKDGKKIKAGKTEKYRIEKIDGRKYAFNKKGIQVTGWRKISGAYYFFNVRQKGKGYMITDSTVNKIRLLKNGKARPGSSRDRKKLEVMVLCSEWADEILKENPLAGKNEKLKIIYDYLRRNLPYRSIGAYRGTEDPDWDLWAVKYVYNHKCYNCHPIAATFAYLANAIGMKKIYIYTLPYWHSFTKINGKYYDVSLGRKNLNSYRRYGRKSYYSGYNAIIESIDK